MKKTLMTILLIISIFSLHTAAYAGIEDDNMIDNAYLLSTDEIDELEEMLDELEDDYNMDVIIVTTNTLEGESSVSAYSDYLYVENERGCGENFDGVIFVVDMYNHEWDISTYGFGITAYTEYCLDIIEDDVIDLLSEEEYFDAFKQFAELSEDFISEARDGEPYDYDNEYSGFTSSGFSFSGEIDITRIIIALVFAIIIAMSITGSMKNQLKSVSFQKAAVNYIEPNSLVLTTKKDTFLFKNVSRVARQSNNSGSGRSRSGGSSIRSSRSGGSRGGRSGRF